MIACCKCGKDLSPVRPEEGGPSVSPFRVNVHLGKDEASKVSGGDYAPGSYALCAECLLLGAGVPIPVPKEDASDSNYEQSRLTDGHPIGEPDAIPSVSDDSGAAPD